jgi:hypothetical protein
MEGKRIMPMAFSNTKPGSRLTFACLAVALPAAQGLASTTYNIQQIGLTGPQYNNVYQYVYQYSAPVQMDDTGQLTGFSQRYGSGGSSLGYDSWLFSGTTNLQIGLTGSGYSYNIGSDVYEYSAPQLMNDAGQVAGFSNRYDSNGLGVGQDSWLFNGTTNIQLGFTGTGYSYNDDTGVYQSVPKTVPYAAFEARVTV